MTFGGSYPPQPPHGPQGPVDPREAKNQERLVKNRRQLVASAPWIAGFFFVCAVVLVVAMFGAGYSQDGRNIGRLIVAVGFAGLGVALLMIRRAIRRQDRERGARR
ncbi:hypothetical protein [Cellulosimicrobium arenosum]|uniref:Uncharacterized protein n=1 Tax=Cellulosimicrobium arenosum TaxID=2708133 RepID=A0A927IZN9_9MICO|nr:hypothetical protein [Cellulosimicrobium arenosum]MBD8078622.1 hypothetical protein [Cellulosimicrobium arenosum]